MPVFGNTIFFGLPYLTGPIWAFFFAYLIYQLFKRELPGRIWLIVLSLIPVRSSHGTKHLFPGVHVPPDPSHIDAVATEIDRRPPKSLPDGASPKQRSI